MALCAATLVLSGCATGRDPRDPLEPVNRAVYGFNEQVDKAVLKPVAQGYNKVVPPPVRGGVSSFFGNFGDVTTAVNNLLQLKVGRAANDAGRVLVNSTVGILGFFDVATRLGLEKHDEDFGQTLGVWGLPDGPYLVLPLLGPSTVRDSAGLVGDYFTDPEFWLLTESPENWIGLTTRVISTRAGLLEAEQMFDTAAIDRYSFLRDAYLQRRRNQLYDGNPPDARDAGGQTRRRTLKEMEEELDVLDEAQQSPVPTAPEAPADQQPAQPAGPEQSEPAPAQQQSQQSPLPEEAERKE